MRSVPFRSKLVNPDSKYFTFRNSLRIRLRLILLGERFFQFFQSLKIIGDIYREILHKQKYQVCYHSNIWTTKKTGKYGSLKHCPKKMSKNWKKSSPIRMSLIIGCNSCKDGQNWNFIGVTRGKYKYVHLVFGKKNTRWIRPRGIRWIAARLREALRAVQFLGMDA